MVNIPPLPSSLDNYQGWASSSSRPKIPTVPNTISPQDMWSRFISKRRPVIIDGHLTDPDWNGDKWTDLNYLRSTAGNVPVKIEPVHPSAGHFGTSVKRSKVAFARYLDILQQPESAGKWYLTTQYAETDGSSASISASDSMPSDSDNETDDSDLEPEMDPVLPAPTNALSSDFPKTPELMGSLVLQQCNLWLGNSKEGKSSGLHHDFHDNLYILLSGYKRFLLFPPSAHRVLYPRGLIERVHHNGLIVYAPPGQLPSYLPGQRRQMPIRPDGLVPSDAARWRRKARLRVKNNIDQQAANDAGEGLREKHRRKGKAKQTRAQELAELALLQAEAELRLCLMDEEGIDPEADTTDEDEDDEDEAASVNDVDLPARGGGLIANRNPYSQLFDASKGLLGDVEGIEVMTDDDDDDDDDEDDDDEQQTEDSDEDSDSDNENQLRRLLVSLPDQMKGVAARALSGDEVAIRQLQAYLHAVSQEDSDLSGDESEEAAEQADFDDSASQEDQEQAENGSSDDGSQHTGANGNSHAKPKRRTLSAAAVESSAEGSEESDDSFASEGEDGSGNEQKKQSDYEDAASGVDDESDSGEQNPSVLDDDFSGLDEGESEEDSEDSDEGDEMALWPGADSSSEFGDVEEGEAELEKLLAMSGGGAGAAGLGEGDEDDSEDDSESDDEQNEPQSFSRIPPDLLHEQFGVADDPSQPPLQASDEQNGKRRAKRLMEEYPHLAFHAPPPIEVFLLPGQMLYLPASWYHEVTSSSLPPHHLSQEAAKRNASSGNGVEGASKVHMALNYWFHPPDALEFEPVRQAPSSSGGGGGEEPRVPGYGVGLGDSATENLGAGTGTHERPYRDAEVWDEVARAVDVQVERARKEAHRWTMVSGPSSSDESQQTKPTP
ncbi:hypothetical protein BCV70DRAFT_176327 [Testicularia cyperi]|uniref:JmjC domain-containing protein n=1 Tax=Testicularia cyperi TaxID=1882483 RepID=A0A317XQR5_9BASI|nr:hypothetical protein BCV70DRAFT_176327 [Testicularia cyperi]